MNIKLNINNKLYNIDENNLILDNKKCYQIITEGTINSTVIRLPKKMFKQYKLNGLIYTNDNLKELAKQKFFGDCILYRFDATKMIEAGYGI